jgi:electron transport complex protein RnfG
VNETLKLGITLLIITAVAAAVLGVANAITADKIAQAEEIKNNEAMQVVLEGAEKFSKLDENTLNEITRTNSNILEINEGFDGNSNIVGYTIKAIAKGYAGGDIQFMIGISKDGYITGLEIISHSETPGLGEKATQSFFKDSFKGKSASTELTSSKDPKKENEIQALTGATKTTNGMVNGVNKVLEVYNSYLAN